MEEKKIENNYFYCYSMRLSHFIRSFNIRYVSVGCNKSNGAKYYTYPKSETLDKIIELYNKVKHTIIIS